MNKKTSILFIILSFLIVFNFSGCSLLKPKDISFFQKEVKAVPTKTVEHKEVIKEAADFVAKKSEESHIQAIKENSSTNLVYLTYETAKVADSLSDSIGKPLIPWKKDSDELVLLLNKFEAKLDRKLEEFKEKNEKLVGKEIESTGISVPYFTFWGIVIIFIGLLWFGLKIAGMFSPAISMGTNLISVPARFAHKGLVEVIHGVESIKNKIKEKVKDKNIQKEILELIKTELERKQSTAVQDVIKQLTKK